MDRGRGAVRRVGKNNAPVPPPIGRHLAETPLPVTAIIKSQFGVRVALASMWGLHPLRFVLLFPSSSTSRPPSFLGGLERADAWGSFETHTRTHTVKSGICAPPSQRK